MATIELWKNESRTLTVTVTNPDDGFPVALDAGEWELSALEFQVKSDVEAADPPLLSKSLGSGITLLDQSGDTIGQAEIEIEPGDTTGMTPGAFKYDVAATFTNGRRIYVIKPDWFTLNGVVNQL